MSLPSVNISCPSISKIYNSLSTQDKQLSLVLSSMNFNGDLSLSSSIDLTKNIEEIKDIEDNKVNAYYLWSCGVWTNSKQNAGYFDDNLFIKPKLAIIHPNNIDNINILSGINTPSSSDLTATVSNGSSDSKFDDNSSVKSGFSSRQGSVPPPPRRRKKLGSFKNYVFFSNRLTSTFEHKLGRNSRGLDYQTLYQFEARKFQFSLLRGDLRFVKDYRTNLEYLIFKFGRSNEYNQLYGICERNDRHPERQPWCCQHILSTNEMINFFGLRNCNKNTIKEFLLNIKIDDSCVEKIFNPNMDYNPNLNKITRMLKHGFYDYNKGRDRYNNNNDHFSDDSSCSQYSNYSRRSGRSVRSDRGRKIKNVDKFSYLEEVAHQLNVGIKELLGLIGGAIVNSFEFTRRHPETAMTQAYIDEERGTINFELVLEAELYDDRYNKYYKFAVPIVECQNKQTKAFYYEAKNILTPKMAIDNIRLNSPNARLDNKSWIYDLNNWCSSFYRKYEHSWFEKLDTLEYKRTNTNRNNRNTYNNNNNNNKTKNNNRNKPNTYTPIGFNLNRNPSNDSEFSNISTISNTTDISNISNISRLSDVSNDRARKTPTSSLILSTHQYIRHNSANNIRDEEEISVLSQSSPVKDYESDIDTDDNYDDDDDDDEDDSDCEYGPIKDFHSIERINRMNNVDGMNGGLRRLSVEDMSPTLPQFTKMRSSEELINFE